MPSLNWSAFRSLPGSFDRNFEHLCRALIRLHYGRFGHFRALANQPGVEFHIELAESCPLGDPPRHFGWQCKTYKKISNGNLPSSSRTSIESSLRKTEKHLPTLTDWILWTPYTLSKSDQKWFIELHTGMRLHLWTELELEAYLDNEGVLFRSSYFGELVLTPQNLKEQHKLAVQPVKRRWLNQVHQQVDTERAIRKMLGEPGAWDEMVAVGGRLLKAAEKIQMVASDADDDASALIMRFSSVCTSVSETLSGFHNTLVEGDLDVVIQELDHANSNIDQDVLLALSKMRTANLAIALDAANALSDMRRSQALLGSVEEFLSTQLVAVLADSGSGKTQMAAQLTAASSDRPAGILLHGYHLSTGQSLDDLAKRFSVSGNPVDSMEKLLAALDVAAKGAGRRLPILIDGLSEAENPKDWKSLLASLSMLLNQYPNVVVVCTLRTGQRGTALQTLSLQRANNTRESFAVMALPDDIKRLEIDDFGDDTEHAIEKYFTYFKIDPGDSEIPMDFLAHPLTLRMFCEVTNPERQDEITVDSFPASLTSLFDRFTDNVCTRVSEFTNLSYSYTREEVENIIYELGISFWRSGKREIDEKQFRCATGDSNRPWNSSIVNLLAQEGLVFRNPGKDPGRYVIVPVYDALGGHLIASALLRKHSTDQSFDWLKTPDTKKSLFGDNYHELASDTFASLVSLAPVRMHGRQLWKVMPKQYRNRALLEATRLEADNIDDETRNELLQLLIKQPKAVPFFLARTKAARAISGHPLNAQFLDEALRRMSLSDRDLQWTEWVRKTRDERLTDILTMESRWKNSLVDRNPSDRLRAKWIMWHLSSTDHELRDIATRALYWYGRGDSAGLFDETLTSLSIDDPYVPERMLAASYGVSMARCFDFADANFAQSLLSGYVQRLYQQIFSDEAPYCTTHLLMREYAYRTIELTNSCDQDIFTDEELNRATPPFDHGNIQKWGEIHAPEDQAMHDSPFRMDFENYTIGSLVPDRGNYHFDHTEYKKVRSRILWRVEQLGWTSNKFGTIDAEIANQFPRVRTESAAGRIDRYGKKYSWVAYFEMAGFLHDSEILQLWAERTSDVDIDPSFPEPVVKEALVDADFLGDRTVSTQDWIKNGPPPDVGRYLYQDKVDNERGKWISLDGFVAQEDKDEGRSIFCFVRAFLVSAADANSILDYFSNQKDASGRLPDKPSVAYTFGGEIPWCESYPRDGSCKLSILVGQKTVKVQRDMPKILLDGIELGASQSSANQIVESEENSDHPDEIQSSESNKPVAMEIQFESKIVEELENEYVEFDALVPVCDFSWEGHQTLASNPGRACSLIKEIAQDLRLVGQPQTFDMYTRGGTRVTCNVSDRSGDYSNRQSMFYMREDFLRRYLENHDLSLLWVVCGERQYSHNLMANIASNTHESEPRYEVYRSTMRFK